MLKPVALQYVFLHAWRAMCNLGNAMFDGDSISPANPEKEQFIPESIKPL